MRNAQQMVRTRCYRDGVLTNSDFSLHDVSEHLNDESAMVWVDLCGPDLEELQLVADELGLHSLAVENATSGRQPPKFNRSSGHGFLTVYAVHLDVKTGELVTGEIAAFVTRSALVTVRKDDQFPIDGVLTRWANNTADLTKHGIGALVYGLLDFVVDGHFDAVQSSTIRSSSSGTCCSTTAHARRTSSDAASDFARALSTSAGLCCPCARCSTH